MGGWLAALWVVMAMSGTAAAAENLPKVNDLIVAGGNADSYVIGSGDVLEISVWKDGALSRAVTVLPDGTINFPLLGVLRAGGRSVASLKSEIEEGIRRFVPDPVLSLDVRQVNSMIVYVIGRVNHPGRFPLTSEITVLQALAMAGGMTPYAELKDIRICREEGDATLILPFNYAEVSDGENLEHNIRLKRGDVIVVP